jgi:SAM-dependent methyltransferase
MSIAGQTLNEEKLHNFVQRVVCDASTAMHAMLCYIGDNLGIFKSMAATGPVTLTELATKTALNERYLQEWLGGMVAAEYIEFDSHTNTYYLPAEHALPLADDDFPYFFGGAYQELVSVTAVLPQLLQSFRSGEGIAYNKYPPETATAIERITRGWYRNQLVQIWLPAMPNVVAKLDSGATVLDIGCGGGEAAIAIAKSFPNAHVFGLDYDSQSIARASAHAVEHGVQDLVSFRVHDCMKLPEKTFDLVTAFEVLHHAKDPLAVLNAVRKSLVAGGTFLVMELNGHANPNDNITPIGKFLYSVSTLYCLPTSLADNGPGIGALLDQDRLQDLAKQGGFSRFNRLPIEDPFVALYELKP